jgi:hypothetical protein
MLDYIFIGSAILGGTLLVCQFLLSVVGLAGGHEVDHDHDVGHDHDAGHDHQQEGGHDHGTTWFVGVLTFRSVVAALTFFGLGGLAASGGGERHPALVLGVAVATGLGALFLVAFIMRSLHKLKAEGTVRYDRAIGARGTVYLTVPGKRSGTGKVTLVLQNRTVEWEAMTADEELPTGKEVVVVAVLSPGTVEVAAASG